MAHWPGETLALLRTCSSLTMLSSGRIKFFLFSAVILFSMPDCRSYVVQKDNSVWSAIILLLLHWGWLFFFFLLLLHLVATLHMLIVDFDVVFVFLDNQPHMLIVVFVFLLLHRCLLFISPLFFHQQYDATFLTNGATFWSDCLCRHLMQSLTFSRCLLFSHCFLLIFIFYDQQCHNVTPLPQASTMWCDKQQRLVLHMWFSFPHYFSTNDMMPWSRIDGDKGPQHQQLHFGCNGLHCHLMTFFSVAYSPSPPPSFIFPYLCHDVMPLSGASTKCDVTSKGGAATRWEGRWCCHSCFFCFTSFSPFIVPHFKWFKKVWLLTDKTI